MMSCIRPTTRSWIRRFTVLGAMAVLPMTGAYAQTPARGTPATTLSELASLVTPGTTVTITDRTGGSITGRLASLAGGSLALAVKGRDRIFAEGDLKEVRARIRDTNWDGAAIGFAIGFAAPALVCTSRSDKSETIPCVGGSAALGGLPGLFIGMVIDKKLARHLTVFRAPDNRVSAGLTIAPIIGGGALGLRMTLRHGR